MSMTLFYGVHLPQVTHRLADLEQSLIRRRWAREHEQTFSSLWLSVAQHCPYV